MRLNFHDHVNVLSNPLLSYMENRSLLYLLISLWLTFITTVAIAQVPMHIKGRVFDVDTGDPIPFVNVYIKGTTDGTTCNAEGRFDFIIQQKTDSLTASNVGYQTKSIALGSEVVQEVELGLKAITVNLKGVTVLSGENPAWQIIRKVVENKKLHDKRELKAYEYHSYNRIEFDIENLSTKLSKRKIIQDIWAGVDTTALEKNEGGNAVLPIFLSESISRYYVKNDPFARREEVEKTNIKGVAIEDGGMVSQLVGAAYQDYNFYQNWLRFLEKEFVSPIADGWRAYYDYEIMDTVLVGNDWCYQLEIFPNIKEEPAFNGIMWITTKEFALRKIDAQINKSSNLNFIESITLKQELNKTPEGPWLPVRTDLKIDVSNFGKNMASIWIKVLNTTSDWVVNDEKDKRFYTDEVIVANDFQEHTDSFWQTARPPDLSATQLKTYDIIDTLVEIPRVKSAVNLIKFATIGYWRRGKIDYGPYVFAYAYNNFEGNSIRLGLKTNEYFDRKITLRGYGGYGTSDNRWKYGLTGSYIISRRPWSEFTLHSSYEVQQAGINPEALLDNNHLFYAATRWQTFLRPYYISKNSMSIQTEPAKGFTEILTLRHDYFDPQYPFYYYENPDHPEAGIKTTISSPSLSFTTKWARDEMFLQNGNERVSLGPRRAPMVVLNYTYGFKGVLNSDVSYHKLQLEVEQKLRLGSLGESICRLQGGYIFGQVPYLLLENHIGNESMFYTTGAYNTMNYFEFVSDRYASLRYEHYFQGLITNKIPLIRKLKWRLLATANVLYGSLRQENIDIMADTDPSGNPVPSFGYLDPSRPFVELGYGIENIFKFIRVDGIHRLTYRNSPEAQKFGVKVSFQFKL